MCWIYSCLTDILGLGSTGNSNQSQVFHKKLFGAITFESLLLKNLQTYLKRESGTRRGLFQAMCLFLFRIFELNIFLNHDVVLEFHCESETVSLKELLNPFTSEADVK